MSHYKTICTGCETLISQCRCPSLDKTIRKDLCASCKANLCQCPACEQAKAANDPQYIVIASKLPHDARCNCKRCQKDMYDATKCL